MTTGDQQDQQQDQQHDEQQRATEGGAAQGQDAESATAVSPDADTSDPTGVAQEGRERAGRGESTVFGEPADPEPGTEPGTRPAGHADDDRA